MIYQRFFKNIQTDNRNTKGGPQGFSLGKRTGGGVQEVEEKVHYGTSIIAFLSREKNSGRDRGERLRIGMRIVAVSRQVPAPGCVPLAKA